MDKFADIADSVPERDEPKVCWCGKHYVGAECDHAVDITSIMGSE